MKYVLVPTPIPEKITLYEALMWVGFRMYFTKRITRNNKDIRLDPKINSSIELSKPFEAEVFFTEENCKKYQLPKNYLTVIIEAELRGEKVHYPFDWGLSWEDIKQYDNNERYDNEFKEYITREKIVFDEFSKKQQPFDKALKDYLEIPKSELFIQLKKGNIKSFGRNIPEGFKLKDYISESISKKNNKKHEIEGEEFPAFTEIPRECWKINNINWDDSILEGENNKYCHVLIDIDNLFSYFPEPDMITTKVYNHNGTLLIDKNNKMLMPEDIGQRGRKDKFKRNEIHAEIIKRFISGKIPKYQNAFIIEIQEWCVEKWGEEFKPSETYLKEFTSPFYKIKRESEIKSDKLLAIS